MATSTPFDLDKLFEGSLRRLRAEAEYFSRQTDHNPELGRLNETHLVKLLRDYLPPKVGIGTGFIVCGGETPLQSPGNARYSASSPTMPRDNSPLYRSDAWSIYPIELGLDGNHTNEMMLKSAALEEAFEKCAMIRAMAKTPDGKPNKAYVRQSTVAWVKTPARYEVRRVQTPAAFFRFWRPWMETARSAGEKLQSLERRAQRCAYPRG